MTRDWRHYLHSVSREFAVPVTDIMSASRKARPARARQALYSLMRHERGLKFAQIGRLLQRNHSTVIHGEKQAEWLLLRDQTFAEKYERARA